MPCGSRQDSYCFMHGAYEQGLSWRTYCNVLAAVHLTLGVDIPTHHTSVGARLKITMGNHSHGRTPGWLGSRGIPAGRKYGGAVGGRRAGEGPGRTAGRANRREDGGTGWWSADGKLITAMERELEPERSSQYHMNLVKSRRPNLEATAGGPTNVTASDEQRTVTYGDNAERYAADGS